MENFHNSKQQQQQYLRECFGQLEACKQLSVLSVLGSDREARQHEAGDQLQVDFDVEPGREKAPAVGEGFLRLWLEHTGKKTPGDAPIPLFLFYRTALTYTEYLIRP